MVILKIGLSRRVSEDTSRNTRGDQRHVNRNVEILKKKTKTKQVKGLYPSPVSEIKMSPWKCPGLERNLCKRMALMQPEVMAPNVCIVHPQGPLLVES